jgi:hypothetical protein
MNGAASAGQTRCARLPLSQELHCHRLPLSRLKNLAPHQRLTPLAPPRPSDEPVAFHTKQKVAAVRLWQVLDSQPKSGCLSHLADQVMATVSVAIV